MTAMSICGEGFTDMFRNVVLSKNYRGAYKMLAEDLGMNAEQIQGMMKGESKLRNCEDDPALLELVPVEEDDEEAQEYRESLRFQSCGIFRQGNVLYRPKEVVSHFGKEDWLTFVRSKSANRSRVDHYLGEGDIFFMLYVPGFDTKKPVIFEKIDDAPPWVTGFIDPAKALQDYLKDGHGLETIGPMDWEDSTDPLPSIAAKSDEELKSEADELDPRDARFGEQVREQAKGKGGSFSLDVHNMAGELIRTLRIPRRPFECWALKGTKARDFGLMPQWDLVCPIGLKMPSDDPMHSDWWFGAGLKAEDYAGGFDSDSLASQIAYAAEKEARIIREKLLRTDVAFLSGHGRVTGTIRKLSPGQAPEKGEIGVISHAGPEYTTALETAGRNGTALITLVGGPLTHLATVAREQGVLMAKWSEAEGLANGDTVTLDAESRTIKLHSDY